MTPEKMGSAIFAGGRGLSEKENNESEIKIF